MIKRYKLLILSLFCFLGANAQYFPIEGAQLHYRLLGFSFPGKPHQKYTIQIAHGNHTEIDSFVKYVYRTIEVEDNNTVTKIDSFGKSYTWRVINEVDNKLVYSDLRHFATLPLPEELKPNLSRLHVVTKNSEFKDNYIIVDVNNAIYDMVGRVVWFLPKLNGFVTQETTVRDFKFTSTGSITMLLGEQAIEINYAGDLIWKAPDNGIVSGERVEHYHHEFTKLENGHYMVLGNELKDVFINPLDPQILKIRKGDATAPDGYTITKMPFTTIIEYDALGKVVWKWKLSDVYNTLDLKDAYSFQANEIRDFHGNAFYFDVKRKLVFLSFKNVNTVAEIDYTTGKVKNLVKGMDTKDLVNVSFCGQHSCKVSQNGSLYLFNNSSCEPNEVPSILGYKMEPSGKLTKYWEYKFPNISDSLQKILAVTRDRPGGNVLEMPNKKVFISNAKPFNNLFIISCATKTMLWEGYLESRRFESFPWEPVSTYRADIIFDKTKLEQLIWYKRKPKKLPI